MSPEKATTPKQTSPQSESQRPFKKTPDSGSSARSAQAAYRRKAASEWVEQITGVSLPASSDNAFRRALKDGTLLCKILNMVRPGCITRVSPVPSLKVLLRPLLVFCL